MKNSNRRRFIRFAPDKNTLAWICSSQSELRNFVKESVALVADEAHGGCGIVVIAETPYETGQKILLAVGILDPLPGEVRWVKHLDKKIFYYGIKFLE